VLVGDTGGSRNFSCLLVVARRIVGEVWIGREVGGIAAVACIRLLHQK